MDRYTITLKKKVYDDGTVIALCMIPSFILYLVLIFILAEHLNKWLYGIIFFLTVAPFTAIIALFFATVFYMLKNLRRDWRMVRPPV